MVFLGLIAESAGDYYGLIFSGICGLSGALVMLPLAVYKSVIKRNKLTDAPTALESSWWHSAAVYWSIVRWNDNQTFFIKYPAHVKMSRVAKREIQFGHVKHGRLFAINMALNFAEICACDDCFGESRVAFGENQSEL